MYDMKYIDDISILQLYGEITLLELEHIQRAIKSLKSHRHHKIVIDLARVDHLHYSAIKRWVNEAVSLRAVDGDLKLVEANKETQHMIQFTGADQYLSDYRSSGEAILSFLQGPEKYADEFCSRRGFSDHEIEEEELTSGSARGSRHVTWSH